MSKFDKIFEAREADAGEVEKSDGQEPSVKKSLLWRIGMLPKQSKSLWRQQFCPHKQTIKRLINEVARLPSAAILISSV